VGDNQIEIQLPGLSEVEKETARNTSKKVAFLEFRLVHPESRQAMTWEAFIRGYRVVEGARFEEVGAPAPR
jgi:hypothetical protein